MGVAVAIDDVKQRNMSRVLEELEKHLTFFIFFYGIRKMSEIPNIVDEKEKTREREILTKLKKTMNMLIRTRGIFIIFKTEVI